MKVENVEVKSSVAKARFENGELEVDEIPINFTVDDAHVSIFSNQILIRGSKSQDTIKTAYEKATQIINEREFEGEVGELELENVNLAGDFISEVNTIEELVEELKRTQGITVDEIDVEQDFVHVSFEGGPSILQFSLENDEVGAIGYPVESLNGLSDNNFEKELNQIIN